MMKELEIAAGVIFQNDKVLIGQRKFEDKFGGKWEFPGGKLERSELPEDCIVRELKEELDIVVKNFEHFFSYVHEYALIRLVVHSFLIKDYIGDISLNEHEIVKWVDLKELEDYDFLEADREIINMLYKKVL